MITTAAVMVFDKNGRVLLQKRDDFATVEERGKWSFWGGHCNSGEEPIRCAKRELREEIDLDVSERDLKFLTVRTFGDAQGYVFAYLLESGKEPHVYEGERREWFDVESARKLPMAFGTGVLFEPSLVAKAGILLGLRSV